MHYHIKISKCVPLKSIRLKYFTMRRCGICADFGCSYGNNVVINTVVTAAVWVQSSCWLFRSFT